MRRLVVLLIVACALPPLLPACMAAELRERASRELGCEGGILTSSAKSAVATERDDGTTYRYCCKNDAHHCAEYFCPDNPKAGCQKLE